MLHVAKNTSPATSARGYEKRVFQGVEIYDPRWIRDDDLRQALALLRLSDGGRARNRFWADCAARDNRSIGDYPWAYATVLEIAAARGLISLI